MLSETTILKCLEIIKTISSIIQSLLNNQERFLEQKAYQLLEYASVYLKIDDPTEGLLRQAIQHLETAISLFDTNPTADRSNRIDLYNNLCVCIAYIHEVLHDPQDIILFWINQINIQITPPDILQEFNKEYYDQKYNEYLYHKKDSQLYYDITEDPVSLAQLHYDY